MNSLLRLYKERTLQYTDMLPHMPVLTMLSQSCMSVAEFGLRNGNSTIAILMGRPRDYIGVDKDPFRPKAEFEQACKENGISATFLDNTDDLSVPIPFVDMLMIDTEHTYEQLSKELNMHGRHAKKYIVFHDTWGKNASCDGAGLRRAISEYLDKHKDWRPYADFYSSYGLTIITRIPDKFNEDGNAIQDTVNMVHLPLRDGVDIT